MLEIYSLVTLFHTHNHTTVPSSHPADPQVSRVLQAEIPASNAGRAAPLLAFSFQLPCPPSQLPFRRKQVFYPTG